MPAIEKRIAQLDWPALHTSLWDFGFALAPAVLTSEECSDLAKLYPSESVFRSHIIMARYRFGRGDYKYFEYPLPRIIQDLREHTYSYLAPLANDWNKALGVEERFSENHSTFLARCKKQGQTRATPLLLHYEAGDFNCLHQDLYGAVAFPMQLACFLSRAETDYAGGEFVLVEQQPRAQSKVQVIAPAQGDIVMFATRYRPVKGNRGYYRTNLRHGVSPVQRGTRFTLGIIFHDAE